jgi:hypothetical protein
MRTRLSLSTDENQNLATAALPIGHASEVAVLIEYRMIRTQRTAVAHVRIDSSGEMAALQPYYAGYARKLALPVGTEVGGSKEDVGHGFFVSSPS